MLKSFPIVLLVLYGIILALGQLFFKLSASKIDHLNLVPSVFLGRLMLQPYFILACLLYGTCTLLWVFILSQVSLTVAYPFAISASILTTSFIGVLVFKEHIDVFTGAAYALIICALVLLSKGVMSNV